MAGNDGHAVVIGASFTGLLAASALSQRFSHVTIFDRDTLPDKPGARPGVPQGVQGHLLHGRGAQALDELLPGMLDEMVAAGAAVFDPQRDMRWHIDGYVMNQEPSGLTCVALSRLLLEHLVRARVAALPNVTITGGTVIDSLTSSGGRVTGVTARHRVSGGTAPVEAGLVVDASGRASRAPHWLRELGYPEPSVTTIRPDLVYVTQRYKMDKSLLDGLSGSVTAPVAPAQKRGGGVLPEENGRCIVMMTGLLGENPPTDREGLLEYAASLQGPHAAAVVRHGEPLTDAVRMRYPVSVRHHYEKLDRVPEGFLVAGDALCSFNPAYGQGITVSALEGLALRDVLAAGSGPGLPRRWYRAAGKVVSAAWMMSSSGDLRYPEIEGRRTPFDGIVGAYLNKFNAAISVDARLATAYLRVANMLDSPLTLMAPGTMLRVLRTAGRASRTVSAGSAALQSA